MKSLSISVFIVALLTCPLTQAAVIDFETFAAGTNITNQIPGVTISAMGGINEAWIFDTNNFTGGDSDLV